MRSTTGAVVLLATAAVLLLAKPRGSAALAGAFGAGDGSAATGARLPTPLDGSVSGAGGAGGSGGAQTGTPIPNVIPPGDPLPSGAGDNTPGIPSTGRDAPAVAPPSPAAPKSTLLVLGSVFFPSKATTLGPDATRMLDGIAATYKGTSQQLEIVGHADARGSAQANLRLSAQRAEAVRSYLAANGIPSGNMTLSYDGARTPMARGVDPEANAQNRRVEVRVP